MFHGFESMFHAKFVVVRYTHEHRHQPHPNYTKLLNFNFKNWDFDLI